MNFDIAVANADMRLLDTITAAKKFIISYSLQSIEKFLRKGQLISYFKNKPTILLIGKYHMKNRSKLLSLFGSKIIDIAIDDLFLNTKLTNNIDSNLAILISFSYLQSPAFSSLATSSLFALSNRCLFFLLKKSLRSYELILVFL